MALRVCWQANWGRIGRGRLLPVYDSEYAKTITEDTFKTIAPLLATADAITACALLGFTELTTDEFATLPPKPPIKPYYLPDAQRWVRKVGITWPGSPEIPE